MRKLLTIGIPTFNRRKKLGHQIKCLERQVRNHLDDVEVIISDNCSTDGTDEMLKEDSKRLDWLKININKDNLGLVGNIYKLEELADSKYIWFIGDDDEIAEGTVERVIEIIKCNPNINMVYINHKAHIGNANNIVSEKSFSGKCGLLKDGKNAFCDIFLESQTSLMFITACVYKKENISEYKKQFPSTKLEAPLFFSIKSCASGSVFVTQEVMINNRWGSSSWKNEAYQIMYKGVFDILFDAEEYGYSKGQKKLMIKAYLLKQQIAHITSVIKAPHYFVRLIFYYDHKHILNIATVTKQIFRILWGRLKRGSL